MRERRKAMIIFYFQRRKECVRGERGPRAQEIIEFPAKSLSPYHVYKYAKYFPLRSGMKFTWVPLRSVGNL